MARTGMNLRLTPEARRGWEKACRDHGVTLTAFVEAIGLALDEHGVVPGSALEVIERARQIDSERRTRR